MPGDALAAGVALVVGYLIGSVPVSALVGGAAGVPRAGGGRSVPGLADIWRLAGPGPGLLALTGELARGVVPVALGMVTWSWGIGWAAGLGALLGASWPLAGQLPGGRGVATPGGVLVALAPAAGVAAVLPTLVALAVGRLLGRNVVVAGVVTWFGSFAVLFLAGQGDPVRPSAAGVLFLVTVLRQVRFHAMTRR